MREAEFIRRNRDKWQDFEKMIGDKHKVTPDQLSDLFIRLTDDLAYSRTYYPESRTVEYLNALAATVHLSIYKNKREEKGRLVAFWKYEVPEICFQHRKEILYALLFFLVFTLIGAVSAAHEPDFVRIILGDAYVNKTLENIKAGRPMGIYASMDQLSMFFQITLNNILVAFRAFIMGVLGSIGTIVLLFYNGVMLGSFQYFFHQQGLLLHSASTIWLHGTIEISVIVIAGGAGLIMGNGERSITGKG